MKKGQGAMEYLMTYGWAILVVLIVGIVLWKTGLFGTSATGANGFNALTPDQWKITAGNNASEIIFHNVAGRTLKVNSINVTEEGYPTATAVFTPSSGVIGTGGTLTANYTTHACTSSTGSTKLSVAIDYTAGGITHTNTGTIYANCE